jgi:hypothetical protein
MSMGSLNVSDSGLEQCVILLLLKVQYPLNKTLIKMNHFFVGNRFSLNGEERKIGAKSLSIYRKYLK